MRLAPLLRPLRSRLLLLGFVLLASLVGEAQPLLAMPLSAAHASQAPCVELVVVDAAVANGAELAAQLSAARPSCQVEVLSLNPRRDGIAQIAERLARSDAAPCRALHVLGHGSAGELTLGSARLTLASLSDYAGGLCQWRRGLVAGAEVLFYACSLAADEGGQKLVERVAALTGAGVAASTNPTGATALGGDWTLEFTAGEVATSRELAFAPAYRGLLGSVPIDNSTGSFAAAQNQVLYAINFTSGKAVPLFTDTAVSGINSVGFDPVKGIYYYTDNANAASNHSIFGYDTRTGQRFTLITDVTTISANGTPVVALPGGGLGSAGGEFANGSFYFTTEGGGPGGADQFFRVDFDPASNGRTVQNITLIGIDNFAGATEFGDFLIDETTQILYVFNSAVGVDKYQINATSLAYLGRDANNGIRQAARDRNNVLYSVAANFRTYTPATGTFGAPKTITTNGTTALGDMFDAAAYLPAESSIGQRVFYDANGNGTDDGEEGIQGLTVQLYDDLNSNGAVDAGETLLATATTTPTGAYLFSQLLPGDYVVRITDPANLLNGAASTTGGFTQAEQIRFVGVAKLNHNFGFGDDRPALTVGNVAATEGVNPYAVFTLSLSRTYSNPVSVGLALADGTASGSDYGPGLEVSSDNGITWTAGTSASFATGTTSVLVRTPIFDDLLDENAETFTLTATRTAGVTTNTVATGTATIADNDPTPAFSIDNVTLSENGGSALFTVVLSGPSSFTTTVNYSTADGTATAGADYTAVSGTLTFAPGVTSQPISVPILGDGIYEGGENFNVLLSAAANATIADNTGVGTILDNGSGGAGADDDRPTLGVSNVAVTEGTNPYAIFTLALSNPSALSTTVALALANGTAGATDFGSTLEVSIDSGMTWASATSATFAPGVTSLLVRVPIVDDALDENAEVFTLSATVTGGTTLNPGASGTATITDNDPAPSLTIDDVTSNEAAGTATFTVTLSAPSSLVVTVGFATANDTATSGVDYTSTSGTLTFAAGTVTRTITVPLLDDSVFEGSETYRVLLSNASNASIAAGTGVGTILDDGTGNGGTDNDQPALNVSNVAVTEGTNPFAVFAVTLSKQSAFSTTASLTLGNGTAVNADYGPGLETSVDSGTTWTTSAAATFAPGATSILVRTPVVNDTLHENTENFLLSAAVTAGPTSNPSATGTATITDNDALPTLSINDVTRNENAGTAIFTVTLSTASGLTTTVTYATSNGTATAGVDYMAASGTLSFAPGVVSQTITINIIDDAIYEATEAFSVGLSAPVNATLADATGVGTIVDNDPKPNTPPVANPDNTTTPEDMAVTIAVLPNDTDGDNDALTITSVGSTAQGSVAINPDGTLLFTPATNYYGPATFTYSVSDGKGGTASTNVMVNVTPVNDGPVANDDSTTTPEDTAVRTTVLINDTDLDGDTLTVSAATLASGQGTVAHDASGVTFTPAPNFNGVATINYSISDGQGGTASAVLTVTITPVNDVPVATNDTATTPAGRPITVDVLNNDSDVEGSPLTVTGATLTEGRGTVLVNADNTVEFTPAPDFTGPVTIVYTVADAQGGAATATIRILVDALPIATDDFASTTPNTARLIPVLNNDADPEGLPLTIVSATILPSQGSLTIASGGQLLYTPAASLVGTVTGTYTIRDAAGNIATAKVTIDITATAGTQPPVAKSDAASTTLQTAVTVAVLQNDTDPSGGALQVVSASVPASQGTVVLNPDGSLTFTAAAGFTGAATITYIVQNPAGATATAPAIIQVAGGNTPPLAQPDSATAATGVPKITRPLLNDTDADNDPLTISSANVDPGQGTVQVNADDMVTFTSAAGFNGTAVVAYQITDGQGGTSSSTISIAVSAAPVNNPPSAFNDTAATAVDQPIDVPVLANDFDPDGDSLTVTSISVPAGQGGATVNADGTIHYIPSTGLNADVVLTYTVSDGQGGTASALVTINVNDNPIAVADQATTIPGVAVSVALLSNDSDPNGNALTLVDATSDPAEGTLVINGNSINFTPKNGFTGVAEVSYTISDGHGGSAEGTAYLTVNNPPVAGPDVAVTPLGQPVNIAVLGNDNDPDQDTLTIVAATVDPVQGKVVINSDGTLTFTPASTFSGPAVINYTISDPSGAQRSTTVTVSRGNLAPTSTERQVYTYCATPLRINARRTANDADGDLLTIVAVSQPAHGKVTIQANGNVFYRPNLNYQETTTDSFTVTLSDGRGGTTTETISVRSFGRIAGTFQGLLSDSALPPAPAVAHGRMTITMNNRAAFTGKLQVDGSVLTFAGTLRGALSYQRQVSIAGSPATLTVTYDDIADQWKATLVGAGMALQQDATGINRWFSGQQVISEREVQLSPRLSTSAPGVALVRVSKFGAVSILGALPGGMGFSSSAQLGARGTAPIFRWVPAAAATVAGALQVPASNAAPMGSLDWSDNPATSAPEILDLVVVL